MGDATEVHLTPTEFRLLVTLARHPGILRSHAELLRGVWGPTYGEETQLLRVTMRNLRAKLADASPGRTFIVDRVRPGLPVRARLRTPRTATPAIARPGRAGPRLLDSPASASSHRPPVSLPRPRALGAPS